MFEPATCVATRITSVQALGSATMTGNNATVITTPTDLGSLLSETAAFDIFFNAGNDFDNSTVAILQFPSQPRWPMG